ncbi:MAG: STAS domain-containing protein [Granulosicoccus sp.]
MSEGQLEVVTLPGQFLQVQLGALKDIVDHLREDGSLVQFDAAGVERIDGAAVQFLLAVSKAQKNDEKQILVTNANKVLGDAVADMGLSEQFHGLQAV